MKHLCCYSCNVMTGVNLIDAVLTIYEEFKALSGLSLNEAKTTVFSSIGSPTLDNISTYYGWQNQSSEVIRHLGFRFQPINHNCPKAALQLLQEKLFKKSEILALWVL